jgi:hypothetical protein
VTNVDVACEKAATMMENVRIIKARAFMIRIQEKEEHLIN